jgi:release factor glutamine methyltransferase
VLEHGFSQAGDVRRLLAQAGFGTVATRHDLGGNPRVSAGRVVITGA